MTSLKTLVAACDLALRAGHIGDATKLLRTLVPSKVPRDFRLPLARLCRRCDRAMLGLKLLTPVVYPKEEGIAEPASAAEWAEFAALRMKIGSVDEALSILSRGSAASFPDAPMLRGFCHMAKWDYGPAAKELKTYISRGSDSYLVLVARVNLAASLISTSEYDEALVLLEDLIAETKAGSFDRLRANCHELRSQIYLEKGFASECAADLNEASAILYSQKTADQLYVQKWSAVLEARRTGSQEPLSRVRKEALQRQNWETVREMDFQILKLKFDPQLFQYLLWGTPYSAYRHRICKSLGQSLEKPKLEPYVLGDAGDPSVDLRKGEITNGRLKPGAQVHRLLAILLKDFYRPISIGALYADLFPGEYYNVFSSPDRIHQALRRARRWLEENHIRASIHQFEGQFALRRDGPVAFILGADARTISSKTALLERMCLALSPGSLFSSAVAAHATGLSPTSAKRFLNWAVNAGHLEKFGKGRATRYSLLRERAARAA